jgi:hypothetical protein
MALIVEDGTGLADADSYLSLAALKTGLDRRGYSYAGFSDTDLEVRLRAATNYVDARYRYKGDRMTADQALEFPRANLVDWSGYTIAGVPQRVKNAVVELAYAALSDTLMPNLDRGGRVVSESVGPISTTYAQDAPAGTVFMLAEGMLKPYIRDASVKGPPRFGGGTDGYFSLGMHDDQSATGDDLLS